MGSCKRKASGYFLGTVAEIHQCTKSIGHGSKLTGRWPKECEGQLESTPLSTPVSVKYQHCNGAHNTNAFTGLITTVCAYWVAATIGDP